MIATVDTSAGPLSLLVTHLQAAYVAREDEDEYLGMRVAQILQIAARLRDVRTPVVAMGDFNTQEGEAAYALLLGLTGLLDVAVSLDRREPTCLARHPYRARDAAPLRIDLMLARAGERHAATPRAIRRVFDEEIPIAGAPGAYSDHAGLLGEVEVTTRRDTTPYPHAPSRRHLEAASGLLQRGREVALARRSSQRRRAGAGLGVAALAGFAAQRTGADRRSLQRRSFLRQTLHAALLGTSTLGFATSAALSILSEGFVADELRGFAEADALVDALRSVPPSTPEASLS